MFATAPRTPMTSDNTDASTGTGGASKATGTSAQAAIEVSPDGQLFANAGRSTIRTDSVMLEGITGIKGWQEINGAFEVDLSAAKINIKFVSKLSQICDYQNGCRTDSQVQDVGHIYNPQEKYDDVMQKILQLTDNEGELRMPYLGAGHGSPRFFETLEYSGHTQGGEFGGTNHIVLTLTVPEEMARDGGFMKMLEESEAIRGALLPIAERMRDLKK